MSTVTGVFDSAQGAKGAAASLRRMGLSNINLLFPSATEEQVEAVPTSEGEQPGMGAAVGGLVGAQSGRPADWGSAPPPRY